MMTALREDQELIPIFTGKNYDIWCVKMRTFLLSKGLWNVIESEAAIIGPVNHDVQKDASALHLIQQGVCDTVFPHITSAATAKAAWDILKKEFQSSAKVQLMPGMELMEVFAVRVESESPSSVYGTIKVNAPEGSQFIFKKEREGSETIAPPSTALSIGPLKEPIHGYGNISFEVDLKNAGEDDADSLDEEFCTGLASWDYTGNHRRVHDELLAEKIKGKNGSVEICFSLFQRAAAATVVVTLMTDRQSQLGKVHGLVTAGSTWIPGARRVLFQKEERNGLVIQGYGYNMLICKSVVAAPFNSTLYICVDLWDYNVQRNAVRRIGKHTANFAVRERGKSRKTLFGEAPKCEVEVSWRS